VSAFLHGSAPQPAPHPANVQLQALALAHQQGQLDRAQYRARRLTLLEAARHAQGVTLRNALPSPPAGRQSPPAQGARAGKLRIRSVGIVISVILIAFILLTFHKCTSGFDRRSVRGEVRHADRRDAAAMALARASGSIGRAQQPMVSGVGVPGEIDVCV
jgi:hypothetical protein